MSKYNKVMSISNNIRKKVFAKYIKSEEVKQKEKISFIKECENIRFKNIFSEEEEEFIKDYFPLYGAKAVSDMLYCEHGYLKDYTSIRTKAKRMGLKLIKKTEKQKRDDLKENLKNKLGDGFIDYKKSYSIERGLIY